jgi:hypothetical protein
MPGSTKPRKRKHRGTQSGKIQARGRTTARGRKEAAARARKGQPDRRLQPPTWRGAAMRGIFFALLLFPMSVLFFDQPTAGAAVLTVIAALVYVPLGFYTDGFFYRRRIAKVEREKLEKKEQRAAKAPKDGE